MTAVASLAASSNPARPRILVADDDPMIVRTHARVLGAEGWEVLTVSNGADALEQVKSQAFDVVVSDISMPGIDGIALLRAVRSHDLDVPVILVTGEPSIERAMQAVEYGAFRFVPKPADPDELVRLARAAIVVGRASRVRRESFQQLDDSRAAPSDLAGLSVAFDRALDALWMAYQPIVRWSTKSVYGYEALVRSAEPSLPHPGALLDAADRLGRMRELGRRIRERTRSSFAGAPEHARLFVNLHTSDLEDELLLVEEGPLTGLAARISLEVTERASLPSAEVVKSRLSQLRGRGYQIALDDLGAGYAGLSSFVLLEPEIVKLDMSLVRDIDRTPVKQRLVLSMVELCASLRRTIIAEGVETVAELDHLVALGCDHFQGYLFAKPGRPFPQITWP